ncbi:GntR family transcriptional regulator [Nocardia sp. NPDC088792]|uniref:GntR family transcriptional regulator n=1 Tax=Nocardia sp. NPDC088792 TaxID=3364332 RepID=UPI003826C317
MPLSERVYRSLQRDLAAGVLVPTERLREERLAETYGVSRTPVREALARLYADGLLERNPDGLYPYRPRVDELGDLYELRIILEARGIQRRYPAAPGPATVSGDTAARGSGIAATDSVASAPPGASSLFRHCDTDLIRHELEIWREIRDEPPVPGPALIAADEQFHLTVLAAGGNAALADALSAVYARVRPVRALDVPTPERIAAMADDHIAIAEHLLADDLDTALRTLLAHLTSSRAHVLTRARRALELTKLGQAVRE